MKSRHGRVRMRVVSLSSSLLALLIAVLVTMLVARLQRGFIELHDATEQYIVCVNTAREMQDVKSGYDSSLGLSWYMIPMKISSSPS